VELYEYKVPRGFTGTSRIQSFTRLSEVLYEIMNTKFHTVIMELYEYKVTRGFRRTLLIQKSMRLLWNFIFRINFH